MSPNVLGLLLAFDMLSGLSESVPGEIKLQVGQEVSAFKLTHCVTSEYRTGNLVVQFSATGVGIFRDRPAVVFISKSHPVGLNRSFEELELWLGELNSEQVAMAPWDVIHDIEQHNASWYRAEAEEIQQRYPQQRFASLPVDEQLQVIDQQQRELNRLSSAMKERRLPRTKSFGRAWAEETKIVFHGATLTQLGQDSVAEFESLGDEVNATANCLRDDRPMTSSSGDQDSAK